MPQQERFRKVVVIGYPAVGKTSFTMRCVENIFSDEYHPTIEASYRKLYKYSGRMYSIEIVDTAGQYNESIFQLNHAVGVHGYVLVYSVTDRKSFEMIRTLNDKIIHATGDECIPRIIVGNKTDLKGRKVSQEEGKKLAKELGCQFVECSAKENSVGVEFAFKKLLEEIEGPEKSSCIMM